MTISSEHPGERLKVAIVVGSTRPGRRADTVARWIQDIADDRDDATYEVVDLANYALPHLDEPVPPMAGMYSRPHTREWAEVIGAYDAYVFVTPEYNHSTSGALKNAIDFLFAEWNDKAAGFVSYGVTAAGSRAVEHLRLVVGELKVAPVRAQVGVSLVDDFEDYRDPDGAFTPREHQHGDVMAMLDDLVAWAAALKPLRTLAAA